MIGWTDRKILNITSFLKEIFWYFLEQDGKVSNFYNLIWLYEKGIDNVNKGWIV